MTMFEIICTEQTHVLIMLDPFISQNSQWQVKTKETIVSGDGQVQNKKKEKMGKGWKVRIQNWIELNVGEPENKTNKQKMEKEDQTTESRVTEEKVYRQKGMEC